MRLGLGEPGHAISQRHQLAVRAGEQKLVALLLQPCADKCAHVVGIDERVLADLLGDRSLAPLGGVPRGDFFQALGALRQIPLGPLELGLELLERFGLPLGVREVVQVFWALDTELLERLGDQCVLALAPLDGLLSGLARLVLGLEGAGFQRLHQLGYVGQ
ncbi:MAG: hypothetical protein CAPSK01_004562 [Candidatus Accumulibacter vicinus]|uniref:Uncharacterized protein n=1 Tax=Candidatus Accumulibacter vicinus TaxID=2954382 RepID=A0A084XUP9_9PROT|nr:MAG: hypothetical protein CAPSK01_004562 [Candidatus Accumulibacter vicinus]